MWRAKCCSADLHSFWEIPLERSLRGFSRKCAETNCLSCFAWKLCRLFGLDPSSRNFTEYHTREHLYSGIIFTSSLTKVLFPGNIVFVRSMNEMRVYYFFFFLQKPVLLSRGIWNARERRRYNAAWSVWKKMTSLCLPFVHSSPNTCEMYVFLFSRLANFM